MLSRHARTVDQNDSYGNKSDKYSWYPKFLVRVYVIYNNDLNITLVRVNKTFAGMVSIFLNIVTKCSVGS